MTDAQVIVFIDYENMHRCAAAQFGLRRGHFDPWALGELIVARRTNARTPRPSVLRQVRVYRGLPDPRKEPVANAANQSQTAAWRKACPDPDRLYVYQRPLRYPHGWPNSGAGPAQEKGVDVALAVDLVQLAYQGAYDVAVICSQDSDLTPGMDTVRTIVPPRRVEVACWKRQPPRMAYSDGTRLWNHHLKQADFRAIEDATNYVPMPKP